MNQRYISFQQNILYLTIISAFTVTLGVSVQVGSIHLFPYRFLLIFMWVLFVGIILMNNGRLNFSHIKVKLYLQFLALWLCYAFLSLSWAADKGEALRDIIFLFMGISIVFFIVYHFRDMNHIKWLYWLWLFIFIALIPIGIWEVTTGNHLNISGIFNIDDDKYRFAPTTVFHNQNDFATMIALTLPMVLVWIRYSSNLFSRASGAFVLIAGLWLLILTYSRSNYIGVLSGLIFWFIFLLSVKQKFKALTIAAFIYLLIVLVFPAQFSDYLAIAHRRLSTLSAIGSQTDEGINVRLNLMKNALSFTITSAGFGVGAGNAEYYMENCPLYPVGEITNVHNWWLETLANYGLVILGGYAILYVSLFFSLWKAYKKVSNYTEKMICEALLVGWLIFFMASFSSSSLIAFNPQWIYLGFVLAFLNYVRTTEIARLPKCIS
jgi:teichuronic acid biosynthesis protein TuaE